MSGLSQAETPLPVTEQSFETEIFGAPVWKLEVEPAMLAGSNLLDEVVAEAKAAGVALVSFRSPAQPEIGDILRHAGFRKVETLVTLSRPVPAQGEMPNDIVIARPEHFGAVVCVGRHDFTYDRYHADNRISRAIADEIKARWVRNGVEGRADTSLVALADGEVAGFMLCMRRDGDSVIDLVGVASRFQGRGFGRKLVQGALAHYAGDARMMWVGTQDTNLISLALYANTGFMQQSEMNTWHWTAQ